MFSQSIYREVVVTMNPSGIRRPVGEGYVVQEVKPGMYVVLNAYAGEYEFFKGRPLHREFGLMGHGHTSYGGSLSAEPVPSDEGRMSEWPEAVREIR
jgi:hypothetical protein